MTRNPFARIGGIIVVCLLTASLPAEEPFSTTVGPVTVGAVNKVDVLSVPFITWGGDVATFLANGGHKTTQPGAIFAGLGLKLSLTPGDDFVGQVKNYLSGQTPFLRGTMSMLCQASEVLSKDPRTRPVVFLQLTWSVGDHMVARPHCKNLDDLKGKKIALQKCGPHVGMLDDILHTAKLDWKDVKVVWTDDVTGDKGPAALFRKDASIDACFAISPDMVGLTGGLDKKGTRAEGTVKDAHVLVSTATMSRSIVDVYACRKDFYDKHTDLVEKFAAGYLKACEELIDLKKRYAAKDKVASPKYQAILKLTQDAYGKEVIPGELDADGLISDANFVGLPGNVSFFTDKGNLSGFAAKQKASLDMAVNQGYAPTRTELLLPTFNYNRLKTLGGLSAAIAEVSTPVIPGNINLDKIDDKNTLYSFTINFEPNDPTFRPEVYGKDFQRAVELASLFGHAVIAVRGHTDPTKVLRDFVMAGIEKGIVRRKGSGQDSEYFLVKDGSKIDLTNTRRVLELIEKEDFSGARDDPRQTVKLGNDLSAARADAVREAIMKYARANKYRVDDNQIKSIGVGVGEPVVKKPRNASEAARNMRVEFRIIKLSPEVLTQKDFDF